MNIREARADAFEHYIARRSEEGLSEEDAPERRGWREFHIKQKVGDIIAGAAGQVEGDWRRPGFSKDLRGELTKRGFYSVKMRNLLESLRLSGSEYPEEGVSDGSDDGGEDGLPEYRAKRLPAEYVRFNDFSLLPRVNVLFEDKSFLENNGTFYRSREIDQTWGIFLDLETLHLQLKEIEKQGNRIGIEECRQFLLWNLYHEYFHYRTEMACANINPPKEGQERKSFKKYDEYMRKTQWGEWGCTLSKCCRRGPEGGGAVDVYYFSGVGDDCACKKEFVHSLPHAYEGYQYPLEEGMANAYAIRKIWKWHSLNPILVKDYIDRNQPLGYSDYAHFNPEEQNSMGFVLGERILTRMLQGMEAPKVNVLQHMLLDGGPGGLNRVLEYEKDLFRSRRMRKQNGYDTFGKIDDVPVHIIVRKNRKDLSRMVKKILEEAGLV